MKNFNDFKIELGIISARIADPGTQSFAGEIQDIMVAYFAKKDQVNLDADLSLEGKQKQISILSDSTRKLIRDLRKKRTTSARIAQIERRLAPQKPSGENGIIDFMRKKETRDLVLGNTSVFDIVQLKAKLAQILSGPASVQILEALLDHPLIGTAPELRTWLEGERIRMIDPKAFIELEELREIDQQLESIFKTAVRYLPPEDLPIRILK